MEFIIEKKDSIYSIKEDGRTIFTCDHSYDDKLLSLYLRNIYGDEALSVFQIKKWYSTIQPGRALDFTIYEQDAKMGELHGIKGAFEFAFQGVTYRFYSGLENGVRIVKCFDREKCCGIMELGETCKVSFYNSTLGSLMSILTVLLDGYIKHEHFSQDLYLSKCSEEMKEVA